MYYNLRLISLAANDELKVKEEDLKKTRFREVKPGTFISKGGNIFNFLEGAEFQDVPFIINGVAKEKISVGDKLIMKVEGGVLTCEQIDFK